MKNESRKGGRKGGESKKGEGERIVGWNWD